MPETAAQAGVGTGGTRLITDEDLERFTAYVRETMFEGAKTHRWPEEVADFWPSISPEYRFQHSLHVRRFVERLQREEGGDPDVLRTAAIFHDVSHFRCPNEIHGRVAADMARSYLESHTSASGRPFPPAFIDKVHLTIDDHGGDKPETYYLEELPLESAHLITADLADKIGPAGVISHLMLCGHKRRLWRETKDTIERYLIGRAERALSGKRLRLTPAGRRLIEERLEWTRNFVRQMSEDIALVF